MKVDIGKGRDIIGKSLRERWIRINRKGVNINFKGVTQVRKRERERGKRERIGEVRKESKEKLRKIWGKKGKYRKPIRISDKVFHERKCDEKKKTKEKEKKKRGRKRM